MGEQRQFKLDLKAKNSVLNSIGDGKFELKQKWFRSSDFEQLRGKIGDGTGKNIYKLVLKKEVEAESKDVFEGVGVKGAFGLIRATWGGTKKWEVGEVSVDEKNKVWLIVAKGDKAMYLMPVVRNSGWCGWVGEEGRKESMKKSKEEVESKGVEDIGKWTSRFDGDWKEWREGQNERLKGMMSGGFSITRKAEIAKWEWTEGGAIRKAEESAVNLAKKLKIDQSYSIATGGKLKFLYKNAGILEGKGDSSSGSECGLNESYYPLDLVVIGGSKEDDKLQVEEKDGKQKITITDTISEVFGAGFGSNNY